MRIQRTTLVNLLLSCSHHSHLLQLHAYIIKSAYDRHPLAASKLLAAAAGDPFYARFLFLHTEISPNLFMYNTVLRSISMNPNPDLSEAIGIFNSLRSRGDLALDRFSFITVLKICARLSALGSAQQIHTVVCKSGFLSTVEVFNSLIRVYSSCSSICDARKIFDEIPMVRDAVSWATLMGGYLCIGEIDSLMNVFNKMRVEFGDCNAAAIVNMISGYANSKFVDEGIHGFCLKTGFYTELNVATALVTMYAKYGSIKEAQKVFDEMPRRDVVLYNCLVDGYAKSRKLEESLSLLHEMRREGIRPNIATFVSLLSVCASVGALAVGQWIHRFLKDGDVSLLDTALGTALVEMYSKCGCLDDAFAVFSEMDHKDVRAWTAMISGCGFNSCGGFALELFYRMEDEGLRPNEVTFLAVFDACGHSGMLADAKELLRRMVEKYGLSPGVEHYGCIVNMLGKAGLMEEAYEMINNLPCGGDATAWRTLLAACRTYSDSRTGELAAGKLSSMDEEQPSDLILLSNIYACKGRWIDVARMRDLEEKRTLGKKEAGYSSIQIGC